MSSPLRARSTNIPFTSPERPDKAPVIDNTPQRGKRIVQGFRENIAPAEGGELFSPSKEVMDERVSQLGSSRLQLQAVATFALSQLATSPQKRHTIGQSGKSEQAGKHAAHAMIVTHWGDSVKARIMGRIVHMGLQEEDEELLRAKGATDAHIVMLKGGNLDSNEVDKVVQSFWQRSSLIGGSRLELSVLNTCYQVDRVINLCVDKRVEAEFRPKVVEWTRDVIAKKISVCDMIKTYASELNTFLGMCEKHASSRLKSLKRYRASMKKTLAYVKELAEQDTPITSKQRSKLQNLIVDWQGHKLDLKEKLQGAARITLPSFGFFGRLFQYPRILQLQKKLGKSEDDRLEYTKELVCSLHRRGLDGCNHDERKKLKREASKLTKMVNGFKLEREGTQFTDDDYTLLFGKLDEVTGERVPLTDDESRQLALDLVHSPRNNEIRCKKLF